MQRFYIYPWISILMAYHLNRWSKWKWAHQHIQLSILVQYNTIMNCEMCWMNGNSFVLQFVRCSVNRLFLALVLSFLLILCSEVIIADEYIHWCARVYIVYVPVIGYDGIKWHLILIDYHYCEDNRYIESNSNNQTNINYLHRFWIIH